MSTFRLPLHYLYFKYTSYPSNSQRTFSSLHKDILYFIICIAIEKEPDYSLPTLLPTQINKALKTQCFQGFLAGDERIELPPKVLETPIIPFDQSPILLKCPKLGHLTGR